MRSRNQASTLRNVEAILPLNQAHPVVGFVIAAAAAVLAAMARYAIAGWYEGQFITFFAAVVVAAVLGGFAAGFVAMILSAVFWWLLFEPSAPGVTATHLASLGFFLFLSSFLVIAIGALRLALLEAQQARELLGSVIEGNPDAVFLYEVSSDELRFAYLNSAGESLLGRSRDELVGRRDDEIISPLHAAENRQVLTEKQPLRVPERLLDTPEGTKRVEIRKFPLTHIRDHQGGVLTIVRDITELRQLEDSLRQSHRVDALGQLTGGIAHDFNNLLAIAIGNLDLLEANQPSPKEAQELLEDARNACLRGAELTGRLLAFARKQTLEPVPTNVNELISEYTKLLARLLGADIDLRLKLEANVREACVDRAQLEAAITNLATNARDAMPKGGRLTISTRNELLEASYTANHPGLEAGEYVAIEVSDNGSGMSPEIQQQAVEPFFTTKAEGHGTGLGLSMVFGFAKQSRGHVRIYSEVGEGTTVTLLLPQAEMAQADETAEKLGSAEAKSGETILVVDDNASLRRVTVKQLSALGYNVIEAEDGPSALRELTQSNPELLLTDIVMPGGMSGVDLGREARTMKPDLKLIYMSGFPEAAFGDRADLDPDVILLRKPFRKADLGKRIREVLDKNKPA